MPPGDELPAVVTPPVAVAPPPDPRVTQLQRDLEEQRRLTQQLQQQMPRQQAPPTQNNLEELNRQFYKDPVSSSIAIARQAAAEAAQANQNPAADETLVVVAQDIARRGDPDLFDKYKDEITMFVNQSVEPQFRKNAHVWTNAFDMIKGKHMRDIVDAERQKTATNAPAVRVSDGGPSHSSPAPAPAGQGPAAKLTDDEREMARNLGITLDSYANGKDLIDKQAHRGDSSWDKVVTFDSRQRRREQRAKRAAAAK